MTTPIPSNNIKLLISTAMENAGGLPLAAQTKLLLAVAEIYAQPDLPPGVKDPAWDYCMERHNNAAEAAFMLQKAEEAQMKLFNSL